MKIFLSYASEDRSAVEPIYYELINSGHSVFFDRKSLPQAEDFNFHIRKAVSRSNLMIFLISPDSVHSCSYTLTELKFSEEKWKHPKGCILPVMIRNTDYKTIPNYLKAITVLEPSGNAAAEVAAWVARFQRKRIRNRALLIFVTFFLIGSFCMIENYRGHTIWSASLSYFFSLDHHPLDEAIYTIVTAGDIKSDWRLSMEENSPAKGTRAITNWTQRVERDSEFKLIHKRTNDAYEIRPRVEINGEACLTTFRDGVLKLDKCDDTSYQYFAIDCEKKDIAGNLSECSIVNKATNHPIGTVHHHTLFFC